MFRALLCPSSGALSNCSSSLRFPCERRGRRVSSRGRLVIVDTVVRASDDGWRYHPKHVEQFPDINELCNVASCWIYIGM
jgi:hypothetical protein